MLRLDILLKRSSWFFIARALILLLTLIIIFSLPVLFFGKIALALIVAAYIFLITRRVQLLKRIQYSEQDGWRVQIGENFYEVKWRGDSTLTAFVSVLRFNLEGKRVYSCLVFQDMMQADDYRRLQVAVRSASNKLVKNLNNSLV